MKPKSVKNINPLKKTGKYVQSRLQFGSPKSKLVKCPKCEMSYSPSALDDVATHSNYHDLHLKGRKWSINWGNRIAKKVSVLTPPPSQGHGVDNIVMIRPESTAEVNATFEIMNIINEELNAPHNENKFWSTSDGKGKAFVYVKDSRAVGAITMEILDHNQGKWMVYETKNIVSHVQPNFVLGISRIWVCKTQRSLGIATKLIDVARANTIRDEVVPKSLVAWSQPSDSGGKLASKYNGVKHKSGKLLLPCYV